MRMRMRMRMHMHMHTHMHMHMSHVQCACACCTCMCMCTWRECVCTHRRADKGGTVAAGGGVDVPAIRSHAVLLA